MRKIRDSPVAKGAILLGVFGATLAGGIASIDTPYTSSHPAVEAAALPKPKPEIVPKGIGYLATRLQALNIGWGNDSIRAANGITAYKVLPDGQQIEVTIFAKGDAVNPLTQVAPNQANLVEVNVFAPGVDHVARPYSTTESYFFNSNGTQPRYEKGSGYEATVSDSTQLAAGIIGVSAFQNGSVNTYVNSKNPNTYPYEQVYQKFGNFAFANSTAAVIENHALAIADAAATNSNIPAFPELVPIPPAPGQGIEQLLKPII